jgi:exosortase/archaeosortase family protein
MPKNMNRPIDEKSFIVRFLASFFLLYLAIHAIDYAFPGLLYPLKGLVALALVPLLSSVGITATAQGTTVIVGATRYVMVVECTGLVTLALLASALYASKVGLNRILRALALYAPFLFAFNIARVLATIWAESAFGPSAFDPTHALSWFLDAIVVVLVWARVAFGWRQK